jgi:hypothetical protein
MAVPVGSSSPDIHCTSVMMRLGVVLDSQQVNVIVFILDSKY